MYSSSNSQAFQPSSHPQAAGYPPPAYNHHLHQQQQQQLQHTQEGYHGNNVNGNATTTNIPSNNNPKVLSKLLTSAPRPSAPRPNIAQQQQQQPPPQMPNSAGIPRQQIPGILPNGTAPGSEMRGSNMQMQRQPLTDQQRMYLYQQQHQNSQNGYMNGHPSGQQQLVGNSQQQQQQYHQQMQQRQQQQQQFHQRQQQPFHAQPPQEFGMINNGGPSTSYSNQQNPNSVLQNSNANSQQMMQQNGQPMMPNQQQQQQHAMMHHSATNGIQSRPQQQQFLNGQQQQHHQPMNPATAGAAAMPNQQQQPGRPQQQQYSQNGVQNFNPQQSMPPQMRAPYPQQTQVQQQSSMNLPPNVQRQQTVQGPQQSSMQFQRTSSDLQGPNSISSSFTSSIPPPSQPPPSSLISNGQLSVQAMQTNNAKKVQFQRQLGLLLHVRKCRQRDIENENRNIIPCDIKYCPAFKGLLIHMMDCRAGIRCAVPNCAPSTKLLIHWDNCNRDDCVVCVPLKQGLRQQQILSQQQQHQHQQEITTDQIINEGMLASMAEDDEEIVYTKPWQSSIGRDVKTHLICKLIKAIFPSPDPAAMHDQRIKDLISYARKIEKEIFERANSREEYYGLLATKIYRIQKELAEKRNRRLGMFNEIEGPSYDMIKQEFKPEPLPDPPNRDNIVEFLEIKREDAYPELIFSNRQEPQPPQHFFPAEVKQEPPPSVNPTIEVKQEPKDADESAEFDSIEEAIPPEELRQRLIEVWKMVDAPEEAMPFRSAVDPNVIGYYDVIKNPMDLTRIREKLDESAYKTPWDFANDMWLMIDNAWLFNKKSTKIYKNASKLHEILTDVFDAVMKQLGYCCGNRYTFTALHLLCYGSAQCTIARNQEYYCYEASSSNFGINVSQKYIYCLKCFETIPECGLNLNDNPDSPPNYVPKTRFSRLRNDEIYNEPFENCKLCRRKWHRICANHYSKAFPDGFICPTCRTTKNIPRPENRFTAKKLPHCELSKHLEDRVNNYMQSELGDNCQNEVVIRVLQSSDKKVETKQLIRERYGAPETFPYRNKAVFAFEVINNVEVCFFGLHVQEYGSECPAPNSRRVYIAYLDSVHFFEPARLRTNVYHEILLGYLDYARRGGYTMAHLWACPPSEGDDYIFHCHPPEQKIPKHKRLSEWYRLMCDKGKDQGVVAEYKNIYTQARDDKLKTPASLPYFEGDLWPQTIEDCIKSAEKKNGGKKSQDINDSDEIMEENGKPSQNKKGATSLKKSASSKKLNKNSSGLDDVADKLFNELEKHKDMFFTIKLATTPEWSSLEIRDPDPLVSCELMDGRDNFLAEARENHWEFSSLRRAKYSTLCLCHSLHVSGIDNPYNCNNCSQAANWHCDTCEDFDLCNKCHDVIPHKHKLHKVQTLIDVNGSDSSAKRDESVRRLVQVLVHASQCRDINCRRPRCTRIKQIIQHIRGCKKRQEPQGCSMCKQLLCLCCFHAKQCNDRQCKVPFCEPIRQKLSEQRHVQNRRAEMLMRRRMNLVQTEDSPPQQSSQQCDS